MILGLEPRGKNPTGEEKKPVHKEKLFSIGEKTRGTVAILYKTDKHITKFSHKQERMAALATLPP